MKIVLVIGSSKTENDHESEDEDETALIFRLGVVAPGAMQKKHSWLRAKVGIKTQSKLENAILELNWSKTM